MYDGNVKVILSILFSAIKTISRRKDFELYWTTKQYRSVKFDRDYVQGFVKHVEQ